MFEIFEICMSLYCSLSSLEQKKQMKGKMNFEHKLYAYYVLCSDTRSGL